MLALLIAAALQSAPAASPPATPVAPVKVVGATDPTFARPDKVVCRSDQHTGSRLNSRTCHTEREWRELEFQSGQWFREQRGLPCTTGSAACGPT